MFRRLILNIIIILFIASCTTSNFDKRLGTGKPKFGTLEIEGIRYDLSSENSKYKLGQPLKIFLNLKNTSQVTKSFEISKNKLVIVVLKNEYRENLKIIDIPAGRYVGTDFSIDPGGERNFEIILDTNDEIFKSNETIHCQVRLFFLPKQFRRNSLSIYLEKE